MDRNIIINNLNEWFNNFWNERNIELIDSEGNYRKIATNRFNACMMYIYDNYIKTLEYINPKGFKQYIYSDYITIVEWYISKCYEYDIVSINGLQILINRGTDFLNSLKDLDNIKRCFIFGVIDNTINSSVVNNSSDYISIKKVCDINNINGCVDNNNIYSVIQLGGDEVEKATELTFDITKKLYQTRSDLMVNKLNDNPTGMIVNANNNNDFGLNYAKERIQETAKARLKISLNDLPMLE